MNANGRETSFDLELDGWVGAALAAGTRTFPELVRVLPGTYPADIFRSVGRLAQGLPAGWALSLAVPDVAPAYDGWPVEHPLDFDWRFTAETVCKILDECRGDSIVVLGAPSVARGATVEGWRASVSLFDGNPAMVDAVRASYPGIVAGCIDLVWGRPVGVSDAAVVVADPPWYPEHTHAFLWASARLAKVGGRVFISLPQEGTRPGILAERAAAFAEAAAFGLRLSSVKKGALAYRMPLFEKNALAAAGVSATVPWNWRRGDLAEFFVANKPEVPRPSPPGPPDAWDQEAIGVVRFKCRRRPWQEFEDPTLYPALCGEVLPSVSRREPSRSSADVWTCGDRIFKCQGAGLFRVIASALGRRADAQEEVAGLVGRALFPEEREMVRRAASQAAAVAQVEETEIERAG